MGAEIVLFDILRCLKKPHTFNNAKAKFLTKFILDDQVLTFIADKALVILF